VGIAQDELANTVNFWPIPEHVPQEFKERPQWVTWRYELRDDKPTKVPCEPKHLRSDANGKLRDKPIRASATDSMTWGYFDDAWNAYDGRGYGPSGYDGIGFVFSSGDPYTGIDLDKVRDPETGAIEEWAQVIIDSFEGYKEVSPSGRGVHIIVRGKLPPRSRNRRGRIEVYSQERYLTITGVVL
jgi:putative DNA primase/helicase